MENASFRGTLSHDGDADVLERFKVWLRSRGFSYKYVSDCVSAARKWGDVLLGKRSLAVLEGIKGKRHVLMGLSNFAKFLGIYRVWKQMLEEYGMTWSDGNNSVKVLFSLLDGKETVNEAEEYLKQIEMKADDEVKTVCRFMFKSGLRPSEVLDCFNLVKKGELQRGYLNDELKVLQHWKYVDVFLRGGKKAFLTVLTDRMLEDLRQWESASCSWYYEKLKRRMHREGLEVKLYLFRKAWATRMRLHGLESEVVDLFQGRVNGSVFVRSYFRPELKTVIEKVRDIVKELEKKLMS